MNIEMLERRDFFSVSTDASLAAPDVDGGGNSMLLPAVQICREVSKQSIWDGGTQQARQTSIVQDV